MFFENRVYSIRTYDDAGELADNLTDYDWTLCTGFRFADLLLVNDATGADGAQEYAVIDATGQVESLTISWMKPERVLETLIALATEERVTYSAGARVNESHPQGRPCWNCA